MLSYVVLTGACVFPRSSACLPESGTYSSEPHGCRHWKERPEHTLQYIKLQYWAVWRGSFHPSIFFLFFTYVASVQIFLLIGTFSIVSLPQSICPTNSAVSQGLLCHLDVCQESQWSFRPLERTLLLPAELMNKSPVKRWSFLEPCFRVSRLETMLKFSIRQNVSSKHISRVWLSLKVVKVNLYVVMFAVVSTRWICLMFWPKPFSVLISLFCTC